MNTDYKYENPLDNGYKRFKLTKKQHNSLFEHRQIRWIDKYEYFYNDKDIIIHKFYSFSCMILSTLLFPLGVLSNGFSEAKDDIHRIWHQKERGSFTSDNVWYTNPIYNKIMEIIDSNEKRK